MADVKREVWGASVDGVPPLEIARRVRRLKIDAQVNRLVLEPLTHGKFCDLVDAAASWIERAFGGQRWHHIGRGTDYTEVGRGKVQASKRPIVEGDTLVAYRGDDGALHFREASEFEDGRFERVEEVNRG